MNILILSDPFFCVTVLRQVPKVLNDILKESDAAYINAMKDIRAPGKIIRKQYPIPFNPYIEYMYPVTNPIPNPLIVGITATIGNPIIHSPKIRFAIQKIADIFKEFNIDVNIL